MSNNALTVENLNKIYSNSKTKKETKAITDLTFEVKEGEVFGLLGPNGAGKTTFLSILGGTVTKTSGNINVWGFDLDKNPRQVKASIGIVPQEVNLDAFFSPKQLLELMVVAKPAVFAQFAPIAFELAQQGHQTAAVIVKKAACFVEEYIQFLNRKTPGRISLIGGVAGSLSHWLSLESSRLLINPSNSPEAGALALARQIAQLKPNRQDFA